MVHQISRRLERGTLSNCCAEILRNWCTETLWKKLVKKEAFGGAQTISRTLGRLCPAPVPSTPSLFGAKDSLLQDQPQLRNAAPPTVGAALAPQRMLLNFATFLNGTLQFFPWTRDAAPASKGDAAPAERHAAPPPSMNVMLPTLLQGWVGRAAAKQSSCPGEHWPPPSRFGWCTTTGSWKKEGENLRWIHCRHKIPASKNVPISCPRTHSQYTAEVRGQHAEG